MIEVADKLRSALACSPYDWLALGCSEHIAYSTGYRSIAAGLFASHRMLALVSVDRTIVVGSASDGAAALESGISSDDYVPFGTFYFESAGGDAPESHFAGRYDSFGEAAAEAMGRMGSIGCLGFDSGAAALVSAVSGGRFELVDATDWMYGLRAQKLPVEIERLRVAVGLAERGIERAIAGARVGMSETELANVVAVTMAEGGGDPRFVVVTSGPRSALSDARPTERTLQRGDLLRFDVGCTFEGYWSDVGRTAVVGEPDHLQALRYAAILAGEEAQLKAIRPGVTAGHLFDVAVSEVEASGLRPYRRHHCGHAIGIEVYERPVIASGRDLDLEPSMVLCLETPYYEIGWGGMMVEDTVVVTEDGAERLTTIDRSMRVIEP